MGDLADFSLDNDSWDPEEDEYERDFHQLGRPRHVTCKNCGTEGLHWVAFNGKWFLFCLDSSRHVCSKPKQDATEVFQHLF
jgi:hypothetical protein